MDIFIPDSQSGFETAELISVPECVALIHCVTYNTNCFLPESNLRIFLADLYIFHIVQVHQPVLPGTLILAVTAITSRGELKHHRTTRAYSFIK